MTDPTDAPTRRGDATTKFVQFVFFKVDRQWRFLPEDVRQAGRRSFRDQIASDGSSITTYSYSTIGLRADADFMLWRQADSPELLQEGLSRTLRTGLGSYLDVSHLLFGLTRPSVYTRSHTSQEQAVETEDRRPYLVLYPFTKTIDWHLLPLEVRKGVMSEHIRVGHSYPSIRQILLYSTGLADQEFVVGYESDTLEEFQDLVTALRATEARRYTLRDTPIFTCIYRSVDETLSLLG